MANVLNYLPKSLQAQAKAGLHEIWMADTRANAETAFDRFVTNYGAKYPKATECLAKDRAALLAFYAFPAEHWLHIRSSNVIESSFATIRHRTDRTVPRRWRESNYITGLRFSSMPASPLAD